MKVAVYCRVCTNLLISSSIISPAHFDDDIVSSDGFMILHGYKMRHNWLIYFLNEYCYTVKLIGRFTIVGLVFSVDIMVFDFLHFVFFQVQYIHYCWKHYVERLRRNFYISFYVSH